MRVANTSHCVTSPNRLVAATRRSVEATIFALASASRSDARSRSSRSTDTAPGFVIAESQVLRIIWRSVRFSKSSYVPGPPPSCDLRGSARSVGRESTSTGGYRGKRGVPTTCWWLGLAPTTSPSSLGRTGKHACHHAPALSGIDAACHHRESRALGSGADWSNTGGLLRRGTGVRRLVT